jgi:hypothetical protein
MLLGFLFNRFLERSKNSETEQKAWRRYQCTLNYLNNLSF